MSSKAQVLSNNTNSFPNNNSGQITPQVLRDFNADFINSVQFTDTPTPVAVSASFAQNAATATSASLAANATSASFALTASFALNAGGGGNVNTGSLLADASAVNATTTFTRGNGTTFDVTVNNVVNADTASNTPNALVNAVGGVGSITFTKGDGTTFPVVVAVSGSTATASLSLNSERLGGVLPSGYVTTAATSSFATKTELNAYTASTNTFTSSIQTQVNALQAATSSYVRNAQTSSMSVLSASFATTASFASTAAQATSASFATNAASAATATSASFATTAGVALTVQNGLNISASNITVANNLVVNGTASFAYTKTTTGSAVVIGDEFIILNADTPTAPFAGIMVYDTGSASTASLEWNGNADYWIVVEEGGQSAAILTGATGSKGSEAFPTSNRLVKGTGNQQIVNSNISDNGSIVSINSNTQVTGSLNVSAGITGSLSGTASFATLAGNGGVTQLFAGPNITLSPIGGTGQVTITSTGGSGTNYNTATGSYGSFYDTGSYAIGSTTTAYSALLNSTDITNGVFVSGSDRVYFTNAGVYNVQFSAQFTSSANQIHNVNVWLRRGTGTGSAVDLDFTNGQLTVPGKVGGVNGSIIAGWNYLVTLGGNDYLQLMYQGEDTGLALTTIAAGTTPTTPVSPALIFTAQRVDTFLSNTGSFSGSFTGTLDGTASFATTASFAQNAVSASYAPDTTFPYTGSAGISGSLDVVGNGSFTQQLTFPTSSNASFTMNAVTQSLRIQKHNALNELIIVNPQVNEKIIGFDYDTLFTRIQFGIETGTRFQCIDVKGGTLNISSSLALDNVVNIKGNSLLTGSFLINPTSFQTTERAFPILQGSDGVSTGGNIIFSRSIQSLQSGSVFVSGSSNYVALSNGLTNTQVTAGQGAIIRGNSSIFLGQSPTVTGSNGSGYDRQGATFTAGINAGNLTITDNRPTIATAPLTISNTINTGVTSVITSTGSVSIANSSINGNLAIVVTGSNGTAKSIAGSTLSGINRIEMDSNAASFGVNQSLLAGSFITASLSGSGLLLNSVAALGYQLVVSGSPNTTTALGSTFVGRWNATDSTSQAANTAFAVGTGTSNTARETALHVSSSGLVTIADGLRTTGSIGSTFNTISTFNQTTAFNGIPSFNAQANFGNVLTFTGSRFGAVNNTNDIEVIDPSTFAINVRDKVATVSGSQLLVSVTTGSNSTSVALNAQYGGTIGSATLTNTNGARSLSVIVDSTTISGSTTINSLTGSLQGTASFATTASYALNAGGIQSNEVYSYSFLLMGA